MKGIVRRYADTAEGQVHYRRAGDGDPLVLMHWCPSCGRQFEPVMPLFAARGYAIYAPDLIGYGDSDKPDRQWTIEEFAVNLGHFLDALGLESVFLAGGHTSAAISAELAATQPGRVRRLVLDGSPAYPAAVRAERLGTYARPLELDAEGGHMLWAWRRSFRRPDMPLDRVYLAALDLLKAGFTWHTGYEAVAMYDMEAALPAITVPTLALTATEDPLFPYHQRVMELLPNAVDHVFEGRGPLGDPERAAEFVEVIDRFLRPGG